MKIFSLISSTAALFSLSMTGYCGPQMTHLESRLSHIEKKQLALQDHQDQNSQAPSMNDAAAKSEMYPETVLDSKRGCHKEVGPYFDLEFLWLRAIEDGIDYAWSINETGTDRYIKPRDQGFEFDPGFRIGLGYNFGYDDWDLHFGYTWHSTHIHSSVKGRNIIGILTLLPDANSALSYVGYEYGKSSWRNQFNVWDLDLGRNYYVGKHLAVKPMLGLKATYIRQHLHASFEDADLGAQAVAWDNISGRFKSKFWGIGPKIGMLGEWELGYGFSLFGNLHTAALYGQFKTKSDLVAIATAGRVGAGPALVGSNSGGHISDEFYRLRMMAYTAIGLEWSRCFWDWFNFSMHIGFEGQYWWQQMEFLNFNETAPSGDLSLTGINAGFRFDF